MIPHFLATYDDGYIKNTFCKLCGKEGMELIGSDCPGPTKYDLGTDTLADPLYDKVAKKKEKFVSGLPDWD